MQNYYHKLLKNQQCLSKQQMAYHYQTHSQYFPPHQNHQAELMEQTIHSYSPH